MPKMRKYRLEVSFEALISSIIMYIIMLKEMMIMPSIRPVSDLRNHFADITKEVQESKEPVFLTKNGVGSIVVMSMEAYEEGRYESEVYNKLREAEIQAESSAKRLSHGEVMEALRLRLKEAEGGKRA